MSVVIRIGIVAIVAAALVAIAPLVRLEQVQFDDIPTYPGATELAAGAHPIADSVAESIRGSVSDHAGYTMVTYALPAETRWEELRDFYLAAVEESGKGWRRESELDFSDAGLSTIGWHRGGVNEEQLLVIAHGDGGVPGGAFLIVALFHE